MTGRGRLFFLIYILKVPSETKFSSLCQIADYTVKLTEDIFVASSVNARTYTWHTHFESWPDPLCCLIGKTTLGEEGNGSLISRLVYNLSRMSLEWKEACTEALPEEPLWMTSHCWRGITPWSICTYWLLVLNQFMTMRAPKDRPTSFWTWSITWRMSV